MDVTDTMPQPLGYTWVDRWAQLPDTEESASAWAHGDIAITAAGEVITTDFARGDLLVIAADGELQRRLELGLTEGHGVTVAEGPHGQTIWVADSGMKQRRSDDGGYVTAGGPRGGQVLEVSLQGEVLGVVARPDAPVYDTRPFLPTRVAVLEEREGGDGDLIVADGYGGHVVHRIGRDGRLRWTIDGEEGAGRFSCPHAAMVDWRKAEPELYVADRENHRIQVYDLDGVYKRTVGEGVFELPTAFARIGTTLVVADLCAKLALFDEDDRFLGHLAADVGACQREGWPNSLNDEGQPVRNGHLRPGVLASPHGVATDAQGRIYVTEFLIGGRLPRLVAVEDGASVALSH